MSLYMPLASDDGSIGECHRGATDPPGASAEDADARMAGAMLGPRRVLVVDDDDPVRETLADLLEDAGYLPVQARNAEAAIAALNAQTIAMLITDLSMPGDDGIALIKHAKALQRGLPAILLTGYAEEQSAVSMIAGVQCHVLRKPVEANQLLSQIASLLNAV